MRLGPKSWFKGPESMVASGDLDRDLDEFGKSIWTLETWEAKDSR